MWQPTKRLVVIVFFAINLMENSKFWNYTRKTLLIYVWAVFSAVTQPNVIVLIISQNCSFTYEQCCVGKAEAAYWSWSWAGQDTRILGRFGLSIKSWVNTYPPKSQISPCEGDVLFVVVFLGGGGVVKHRVPRLNFLYSKMVLAKKTLLSMPFRYFNLSESFTKWVIGH